MIRVEAIRNDKEAVIAGLKTKNFNDLALVDKVIELDDRRKEIQGEVDQLRASENQLSKEIGTLFKTGKAAEAGVLKEKVGAIKETRKAKDEEAEQVQADLREALIAMPNIPHPSVPPGNSDEDNEVFKAWDAPMPNVGVNALPHWELAKKYELFDLEAGVKITGAGFPLYRGKGARLQRALINFFLDEASAAGYQEVVPPFLVNEDSGFGTGSLPDKEGQMYYIDADDLYLIPTAEVPVTNIYRNDLLKSEELPIKMCAYSPCFRREAGSYGAHVRGLNRVHQFEKVEIVQIVDPKESYAILDEMVAHIEGLLGKLKLPYRILRLCGGDTSFASALTYDFEVFSAAQERWLEVSSVSNFESFQANRMKCRFKDAEGNKQLVHTLNGSALALARIYASILENFQTENGIEIPEVLRSYTGFDIIQ